MESNTDVIRSSSSFVVSIHCLPCEQARPRCIIQTPIPQTADKSSNSPGRGLHKCFAQCGGQSSYSTVQKYFVSQIAQNKILNVFRKGHIDEFRGRNVKLRYTRLKNWLKQSSQLQPHHPHHEALQKAGFFFFFCNANYY